jgi:dTDP-4-dehydrorhamnose reductase
MTILITGANGFVGNYLSEALAPAFRVVATGKGDCRLSFNHPSLSYTELDITDEAAVARIISQLKPAVVIHAAAISQPDRCEQDHGMADKVNVDATKYLLNASATAGAHFIFLSTDFVFDGEKGMYAEDDATSPVNYYGETKLRAEKLVRAYQNRWTIVRTVLVYGARRAGRGNLLTMVADNLRQGRALHIYNDQWRTPTFVCDLVAGIARIVAQKATGVFHLSGEDGRTPYQIALETAEYLKLDSSLINAVTEQTFSQPARRPPRTGFDISKAKRELGYGVTSFEAGLKATFQHEKERGFL